MRPQTRSQSVSNLKIVVNNSMSERQEKRNQDKSGRENERGREQENEESEQENEESEQESEESSEFEDFDSSDDEVLHRSKKRKSNSNPNSQSTQIQRQSPSTPNKTTSKSPSTPNKTKKTVTPNKTKKASTPNKTKKASTPNKTKKTLTPNKTKKTSKKTKKTPKKTTNRFKKDSHSDHVDYSFPINDEQESEAEFSDRIDILDFSFRALTETNDEDLPRVENEDIEVDEAEDNNQVDDNNNPVDDNNNPVEDNSEAEDNSEVEDNNDDEESHGANFRTNIFSPSSFKLIEEDFNFTKIFNAHQHYQTSNWKPLHHPFPLENPISGVKDLPQGTTRPVDFFRLLFSDLSKDLYHASLRYIEYIEKNNTNSLRKPWIITKKETFTEEDIEKYLVIFFIFGLYRVPNIADHWKSDHFLKSLQPIFSYSKWRYIHRVLHCTGFYGDQQPVTRESANLNIVDLMNIQQYSSKNTDLTWLIQHSNSIIKKYYFPKLVFSFDDDLYKWTGRGGTKKYLPAKADGIGNILWKLADENKYIYHFEVEHHVKKNLKAGEILNQRILKNAEESVPPGPFCFVIDAGILGSFENARYLGLKKRFYIVSVGANRIKDTLENVFDDPKSQKVSERVVDEYKCGTLDIEQNNKMVSIAWKAKKDKIVYFYTNISNPLAQPDTPPQPERKKDFFYPRVASVYNYTHNYVDVSKMIVNRHRNIHRARTYWRSVFNDIINVLLFNSYILFNLKSDSNLSFRKYIYEIAGIVLNLKDHQTSTDKILRVKNLIKHKNQRKICQYKFCKEETQRINTSCSCCQLFYHPLCSIFQHNPSFEVYYENTGFIANQEQTIEEPEQNNN